VFSADASDCAEPPDPVFPELPVVPAVPVLPEFELVPDDPVSPEFGVVCWEPFVFDGGAVGGAVLAVVGVE